MKNKQILPEKTGTFRALFRHVFLTVATGLNRKVAVKLIDDQALSC
jgi:hypothetical protein